MTRAYNVVDADGHILEPLDLWDNYIDPEVPRPRAAHRQGQRDGQGAAGHRGAHGRQRSSSASAAIGAVGARQGVVAADTMEYKEGRAGGFDPHARIPDMDADGIDAAFLYPSLGLFSGAIHDSATRRRGLPRL